MRTVAVIMNGAIWTIARVSQADCDQLCRNAVALHGCTVLEISCGFQHVIAGLPARVVDERVVFSHQLEVDRPYAVRRFDGNQECLGRFADRRDAVSLLESLQRISP